MPTIPSLLPEWALDDVQDEISGQYNVVEPPTEIKLIGWTKGVKPNRQFWNWFNRTVYDWISYFNDMFGGSAVSLSLTPTWLGLTVQPSLNNFYYSIVGDKVFFNGNIQWSGNLNVADALSITNLPFTSKNITAFLQCCQVERGTSATMPGGKTLYGTINENATVLLFRETDLTAGTSNDIIIKGSDGTIRFSGYYIKQ